MRKAWHDARRISRRSRQTESRLRARLSTALSYLLSDSGQKVRAFELATQAVEHARASGDDSSLARALNVYAYDGDVPPSA